MKRAELSALANQVTAVVITYNPDGNCETRLTALALQVGHVVVIDNGSEESRRAAVAESAHAVGAQFISLAQNLGIAAATNIGIEQARARGARFVLLMDQDSLVGSDMVTRLLEVLAGNPQIGAAGPLPSEEREGEDQLVYVAREWAPKRATAAELERPVLDVAFLIASGCLIRMETLDDVGGMGTALFIDHVDLEWGVRARSQGWRLVCVTAARLYHSLGDAVVLLPGRTQPVHVHAPIRNYYLVRNTARVIGSSLFPGKWRVRYAWWLAKYLAFNGFLLDRGAERRQLMRQGLRDARRRRGGRIGDAAV
ncbi:glycosyltransferase family 2 protein [Actinotignum timonense]|uniref:glycosyltransferase family 2 protein n=1 Tax=Actinotignum TaxID=1653174 RepID=UPI00254C8986|nr:glycosyltransferase family 2 protein [Actinotignum timonense]MDK6590313.1 glycosyltransferase family 2 protein [Actinotignum timonense]MDK6628634.1 glycosyltransferase family 2 protein [Actinotignum timonense]MDK6906128.1 glycosyltransferase family 2 protein [Actinotignum timonense]MDK8782026.1 glycosyltransferase family 2 protein [Actinotignum timonense]MDY5138230.1 glycosyltransferase family 2 protein [Actinotignum timonense]